MADQRLARHVNERDLLTLLRRQGPLSRAEISRRLGLTPATITRLVSDLAQRGLLTEIASKGPAGAREPGRPGTSVGLNEDGAFFLGVEIGVGIIRHAVLNLAAGLVDSSEVEISRHDPPDQVVRTISREIVKLGRRKRYSGKIMGLGLTVPGLVRTDGYVVHLPILGWKDTNLLGLIAGVTDLPCAVENNANAAAFGAMYCDASLGSDSAIFLKLGTGCGGAVVLNGRLLRGASGVAGELGHVRVSETGVPCSCGQVGCLESWVNLAAVARCYLGTDRISDAERARLPEEVARAVIAEEPAALAALDSLSRHLGLGIISLVNVFNPASVVLGGVMRPLIAQCLDTLRPMVAEGIVPGIPVPELRLSTLGVYESAIGAASLAHHRTFDVVDADYSLNT